MDFLSFLPIIVLLILFFFKVPVAYSLIIATAVYFVFINHDMPIDLIVQQMMATTESFTYLAIPFFTAAGVIFNYSGISSKLMALATVLIGHVRGGMGQVNVLLSAMMGGLSGSANADAAMSTKIVVPEMVKLGYSKAYSTVVTSAAAVITPIIPPGIILIMYAVLANVSVAKMFFAGVIPGLILTIALMILVWLISRKRNYAASREKRATMREIGKQALDSIWALALPLGILMGLRIGMFTPTEAGAVSIIYAILVGAFIYKELKWADAVKIIQESVTATAGIMFIIAAANSFGSYLTWERIPILVSEVLIGNISDPIILLIVINLFLLVAGCFFEGGAAMILLAPLLVPAVSYMGIDLIHFGIIMSVNLTIAGFTPPFGTMMFITTTIAGVKITDYMREAVPFLLVLIFVLFIITFFPQVVLFLPNLLT